MALFKFFPKDEDLIDKVFIRDGFCAVKCSLPKDYNDPYELFLGVDNSVGPRDLAFYYDVIQEIPQIPTTCFSRTSISLPMWAHYASNHMGYVIEYDIEVLKKTFSNASITDMKYISEPNQDIKNTLQWAVGAQKPRYLKHLHDIVKHHAYFSKLEEWSYEKECRFVATGNYIENINSNDLLFIPIQAIKSIILGKNITELSKMKLLEISVKYDIKIYNFNISKTTSSPFFTDLENKSYIIDKNEITIAEKVCKNCPQPLFNMKLETCEICSITDAHKQSAAERNTFRMLNEMGLLQEYLSKSMGKS